MVFDIDDINSLLADGSLVNVIVHEMGHVLGLGASWEDAGVVLPPNYIYTGSNGKLGYTAIGGASGGSPPIEKDFDDGTVSWKAESDR